MSEDSILKCLIAFILGWFLSRHMGNGFSVGGGKQSCEHSYQCPAHQLCQIDPNCNELHELTGTCDRWCVPM